MQLNINKIEALLIRTRSLIHSRGASLLVFTVKIIGAGSALLLNVVVARTLTLEDAGLFFINVSIVTLSYAVARFGFGYTTYRYIAEVNETGRAHQVASIARFSINVVLILSIITTLFVSLFIAPLASELYKSPQMKNSLILMSFSIPVYCVGGMYSEVLKGLRKPIKYSLFESVIIKILTIPLALALGNIFMLHGVAWAFLIANIIALIFVFIAGTNAIKRASSRQEKFSDKLGMIRSASYFAGVSYFTVAAQWISPIIVGAVLAPSAAAVFFTAYRTVIVLDFVLLSIAAVATPLFVRAFAEGRFNALFRATKTHMMQALVMSAGLGAVMFVGAPLIMKVYGDEFLAGVTALRIMIVIQFFATPLGVFSLAVSAARGEKAMAIVTAIACTIGIYCAYIGAKLYGINGAAFGTIISTLITNLLLFYWFIHLWRSDEILVRKTK